MFFFLNSLIRNEVPINGPFKKKQKEMMFLVYTTSQNIIYCNSIFYIYFFCELNYVLPVVFGYVK